MFTLEATQADVPSQSLASHHSWMSSIKGATKKATLANFCGATIGHKNIGFWSKEPQRIQNNYKPIDLYIFTVTVIRNWVRITVYIKGHFSAVLLLFQTGLNWFIGCLQRTTYTVHLRRLTWLIHTSFLPSKLNLYINYNFWPKNDGEKWCRKNTFEIPPCRSHFLPIHFTS